jgi:hypothetical protein
MMESVHLLLARSYSVVHELLFFSQKRRRAAHHYIKKIIIWDRNPYNTTQATHTPLNSLYLVLLMCIFIWLADDGTSSAVIDMEYFKRSSIKFQRLLVSAEYSYFLSWELDLPIDTNALYNFMPCEFIFVVIICFI